MKVAGVAALIVLAASADACRSVAEPELGGAEKTVIAVSEVGVDRGDCRVTLSASVRGATGSFSSPAEAARSVKGLPSEGSLVHLSVNEDSVAVGWMEDGELMYVIDTHRQDGGWMVGSYEKCLAASRLGGPAARA